MPKVNLSGMTVEALMDLREQIDETLVKRRAELETQLARMGKAIAVVGGRGGGSGLRGRKVPPNPSAGLVSCTVERNRTLVDPRSA